MDLKSFKEHLQPPVARDQGASRHDSSEDVRVRADIDWAILNHGMGYIKGPLCISNGLWIWN